MGYCTCMGIYCVERVVLAELPELARNFKLYTLIEFIKEKCSSQKPKLCL